MQIDWFTYGAQIVNFLILVYLLQRFLYGPLLAAMTTRAERLRADFAEAEEKAAEAKSVTAEFRQQQATLEAEKAQILAEAQEEVAQRRRTMLLDAREEVESMQARWYAAVERDRETFLHELRRHVSEQLFDLARSVLQDLAHADLEAAMVATFCEKLGALDATTRHSVARSLRRSEPVITINTALHLDEAMRRRVDAAAQQIFAGENIAGPIHIRFRQNPALITGVELVVQERRLAWSVEDHLGLLEKQLNRSLDIALAARDDHAAFFATATTGEQSHA